MRTWTTILLLLGLAGCIHWEPEVPAAHPGSPSGDALAILGTMSEFLAAQSQLEFRAVTRYEVLQDTGEKLEFGSERRYLIRRPDRARLRAVRRSGLEQAIYVDGDRVSVVLPRQGAYSSVRQGGDLSESIDLLVEEFGVQTPLADLLHPELAGEVERRVRTSRVVGTERLDGAWTDHLAFRSDDVDLQLWVARGAAPLPVRVVLEYRSHEGSPTFAADLGDWDFAPEAPDSAFTFAPPEGARRVPFFELLRLQAALHEDGS